DGVRVGERTIAAKVILWAAGVRASPVGDWLGVAGDAARRVPVEPDLTLAADPAVFVIGDTATIAAWDGKPVPGIAPAAKQEGRHVAYTIKARLRGTPTGPFRYRHAGSL